MLQTKKTLPFILGFLLPCSPPGGGAAQEAHPRADTAIQWITPVVNAPRLQHRTFDSKAANAKVSYFIYSPEAYDCEPERRFPVLYWLHGTGGGLTGAPLLVKHFNTAIRTGKAQAMLVVFANGLTHSMWCDSKDGSVPMETIVVMELVPHIDASFRTIASREGRLIEGFSMGGYGAARLGFKYHDVFRGVSILAGGPLDLEFRGPRTVAFPEEREKILQNTFGGDLEYYKAQSPWVTIEQNAASVRGRVLVRHAIGELDDTLALNRAFHSHMTQLEIPHTFHVLPRVDHNPIAIFNALGEENWRFYRSLFDPKDSQGTGQ